MLQLAEWPRSAWPMTTQSNSPRHRPDLLIIGRSRQNSSCDRTTGWHKSHNLLLFMPRNVRECYERLLELSEWGKTQDVLQGICYQRLTAGGGVVDFTWRAPRALSQPLEPTNGSLNQSGYIQLAQAQTRKKLSINKANHQNCFESLFKWFSIEIVEFSGSLT